MSVRLTKKKQKEILKRIDQIVMLHRGKIYVALGGHDPDRIDRKTAEEVMGLIDNMSIQLASEIMPMIEEVLAVVPPVLPMG